MIDLDEAERIGKHAWDAPWFVDEDQREEGADQVLGANDLTVCFMSTPIEHSVGNSAFIVFARNNWQAMVDELRRLRAQCPPLWEISQARVGNWERDPFRGMDCYGKWYIASREDAVTYLGPTGPQQGAYWFETEEEAKAALSRLSNER